MSLTSEELTRIATIEEKLLEITLQVKGAASTNMLNRLLTLANKEISDLQDEVTDLNTKLDIAIELLRKLQ